MRLEAIGGYEVEAEIARGGMGRVYRARDPGTGRQVALKLLLAGALANDDQRRRFRREAEALAKVSHPHVVRVHSSGDHDGAPYLVLDFVEGRSLKEVLEREGPLEHRAAATVCRKLADALAAVHAHGILHRDVKPANVLVDEAGEPHLADFGMAKDLGGGSAGHSLSKTGCFLGTPGYWPPEQATGRLKQIGPPSDVYALGATLYVLLTGQLPVRASTLVEYIGAAENQEPLPPSTLRAEVGRDLDAICLRCLEKPAEARYPTAAALRDDLDRYLRGERVSARGGLAHSVLRWLGRRRAGLAGALSLAVAATSLAYALTAEPQSSGPTQPLPARSPSPRSAAPAEAPPLLWALAPGDTIARRITSRQEIWVAGQTDTFSLELWVDERVVGVEQGVATLEGRVALIRADLDEQGVKTHYDSGRDMDAWLRAGYASPYHLQVDLATGGLRSLEGMSAIQARVLEASPAELSPNPRNPLRLINDDVFEANLTLLFHVLPGEPAGERWHLEKAMIPMGGRATARVSAHRDGEEGLRWALESWTDHARRPAPLEDLELEGRARFSGGQLQRSQVSLRFKTRIAGRPYREATEFGYEAR
jgi:serine/threonine protein kinase